MVDKKSETKEDRNSIHRFQIKYGNYDGNSMYEQ